MAEQIWYSDNTSHTFADVLAGVGLAETLTSLHAALGHGDLSIVIEDHRTHFQVHVPALLDLASLRHIDRPFLAGRARPIITTRQPDESSLPDDLRQHGFAYDDMHATAGEYYVGLQKLSSAERKDFYLHPEAQGYAELRKLTPHPDLRVYAYVNHMATVARYNLLLQQWYGTSLNAFRLNLACVLQSFGTYPNPIQAAAHVWENSMLELGELCQPNVTRWQLTNPTTGKGTHTPKANAVKDSNIQGFWLLEYLKLVGLFTVSMPVVMRGSSGHSSKIPGRKTYVLHPVAAELSAMRVVMERARTTVFGTTAAKEDVLAALRMTRLLLESQHETGDGIVDTSAPQAGQNALPHVPVHAHGFDVACYKNMGFAHALTNLATLRFPPWHGSTMTDEAFRLALALTDEHIQIIEGIRNDRDEEGEAELKLVRLYQDFLTIGDMASFFDFAAFYGTYVVAKLQSRQLAWPLSVTGMERVMAFTSNNELLVPILENEGFKAIARAIRYATVTAHGWKLRDPGYPYEIHYSLGREIRDTAAYPADFLGAIADFMFSYNRDIMRVEHRIKDASLPNRPEYRRRFLRTRDMQQLAQLIDAYGSEVVCRMLVASGHLIDASYFPRSEKAEHTVKTDQESERAGQHGEEDMHLPTPA